MSNNQPLRTHYPRPVDWLRVVRCLRQAERGEDQTFEFTMAVVPIVLTILLIAFATVVRSSQMPAWMAATECARAAISTRDESLGREQAQRAALDSLTGNSIRATSGQILITGNWEPNSTVTCRVTYIIDVSGIAGFSELTGGGVPVTAEVSLHVEPYKSRWQ